MARGINKVILIGNLGADPEVRYMPSGGAVANISLATTENWKDKQTGENQQRTEWHRVAFFNRLAEIVGEYLRKGAKVYVEGTLRTRKWQDQSGADRYTTEIIANELQMLDGRGGAGMDAPPPHMQGMDTGPSGQGALASPAAPAQTMPQQEPAGADMDDDIPF